MAKGITKRSVDYNQWYVDIVQRAELADYSPVRGCMVIRPNGYAIWERMRETLDRMFKETGHLNAYFPFFIPRSFLEKEAEHVEGFALECAVVTHSGLQRKESGLAVVGELEEPLICRPTSETIIWAMYKKWIRSFRDLPILYNQWANIIRWEMRTRLFLRTTEFLWQEGHTAHATKEEAHKEAMTILEIYRSFAEDTMAMPVHIGRKTAVQRFPGAVETYCIEAMMQDGRALQSGTSHDLGQNFAKAFDVKFQTAQNTEEYVWATSWGVSTRLIGGLIMTHSDDDGFVLPPKLATNHAVIVPIYKQDDEKGRVLEVASRMRDTLKGKGYGVILDDRDQFKPGYKFAEWELKGIPLRVELGPRDLDSGTCVLATRHDRAKSTIHTDILAEQVEAHLDRMQRELSQRAKDLRTAKTRTVDSYDEFKSIMEEDPGFVWAHWNGDPAVEARIQEETKATIRLIPFEYPDGPGKCMITGEASPGRVLFAKAY